MAAGPLFYKWCLVHQGKKVVKEVVSLVLMAENTLTFEIQWILVIPAFDITKILVKTTIEMERILSLR